MEHQLVDEIGWPINGQDPITTRLDRNQALCIKAGPVTPEINNTLFWGTARTLPRKERPNLQRIHIIIEVGERDLDPLYTGHADIHFISISGIKDT